jgi:galactokinase
VFDLKFNLMVHKNNTLARIVLIFPKDRHILYLDAQKATKKSLGLPRSQKSVKITDTLVHRKAEGWSKSKRKN